MSGKTIKYSFEFVGIGDAKKIDEMRIGISKKLSDEKINGRNIEIVSIKEICRQEEKDKRDKQPDYLKIVIGIKKDSFENKKFNEKEEYIAEIENILVQETGGMLIISKDITSEN